MSIRTDNFYISKMEHYNKSDKLIKIMTTNRIEQINGYWIARESEMQDLEANHTTKMIINEIKMDSNIFDKTFSKRNLVK